MKLCLSTKDLVARLRMAKTAEALLTEPQRPKAGQGRPLLVLRLARCEGRCKLLCRGLLVIIITFVS